MNAVRSMLDTSFPRRCSTWLCAALCVSLMLSATASRAQVASSQVTAKANRATAESLTTSLMSLHAQYRTADHAGRAALILQLRSVAAERQQFLSSLIQSSPGEVLRVAIPGNIAATLPASVRASVEQETDAQGQLQVMYEDGKNSRRCIIF